MKHNFLIYTLGVAAMFTGCKNGNQDFPDFNRQAIYFAKQSPIRTVTLGEDGEFDTTLDNQHIVNICPVLGGVNTNKSNRWVQLEIDPTLLDGAYFSNGEKVEILPENYYTLGDTRVTIKKGELLGYLPVHLEDAFFADPKSTGLHYVLPVKIASASTDILEEKDYTLYAIDYKNQWAGCWLSRGKQTIDVNGNLSTYQCTATNWEKADLRYLTTRSLTQCAYEFSHNVDVVNASGNTIEKTLTCTLLLNFSDDGGVKITTDSPDCTASGSGKYTYHGALNAWGSKDRDNIQLNASYEISYVADEATGAKGSCKVTLEDNLVMRDRQNSLTEFSFSYK
jgi:hypothetical protein